MTVSELKASVNEADRPPDGCSLGVQALWYAQADQWEKAHDIAQDLHTPLGSWIHALLHLMEGDVSNAHYWYHRAGQKPAKVSDIPSEWEKIAATALNSR